MTTILDFPTKPAEPDTTAADAFKKRKAKRQPPPLKPVLTVAAASDAIIAIYANLSGLMPALNRANAAFEAARESGVKLVVEDYPEEHDVIAELELAWQDVADVLNERSRAHDEHFRALWHAKEIARAKAEVANLESRVV